LLVSKMFNVGDVDASQSSSVRPRTHGKLQNFCDVRRLCSILKVAPNQKGADTRLINLLLLRCLLLSPNRKRALNDITTWFPRPGAWMRLRPAHGLSGKTHQGGQYRLTSLQTATEPLTAVMKLSLIPSYSYSSSCQLFQSAE